MTVTEGPWELVFYDSQADDRRGWDDVVGNYRSRDKAQAYADARNAEIIERFNRDAERAHRETVLRVLEHNVLVAAGLRGCDGLRVLPSLPVPITDQPTYGNWWSVRPMEFDDDN